MSFKTWILSLLIHILSVPAFAVSDYEEADEFIKIEVDFHTDSIGLIWAYRCEGCRPERFMFDGRLLVQSRKGTMGPGALKTLKNLPVVITWYPNTFQALRILPME